MDVRLSNEQRALADAAGQVVDRLGPHSVGALDDEERRAKLDAAVASTGWLDLRTAADDGSPWASGVEVGIVAEALGRGAADTAFLGPTLAADLRRRAGAPAAARPETVLFSPNLGSLAVATEVGGGDLAVPAGAIAVDVPDGPATALLLAAGRDGFALATVEVDDAGTTTDLTRRVAVLGPDVTATAVEGARRVVGPDVVAWTALGLATCCADLVGTMDGAVRLATDYAGDRSQYGRAIGSFQAVQHLLADAFVAAEGSRSVARHAAWAVDALEPDQALAAASVATAYCTRAARRVCEIAIQVHGGIGNTWECMAHVHLRRALLSSDLLGGVDVALARVLQSRGVAPARVHDELGV